MMLELEARHWSQVRVVDERYLCLRLGARWSVILDRCKHKGGPLSKGTWDEAAQGIRCPWHDLFNSPRDLARKQVPSVRVGAVIRFLVPDPAASPEDPLARRAPVAS